MSRYISEALRGEVAQRAQYCCEYCLIPQVETYLGCEVDHIISLKHGGATELENLALACFYCNRNKGSDIGSLLLPDRSFVRFFDPRRSMERALQIIRSTNPPSNRHWKSNGENIRIQPPRSRHGKTVIDRRSQLSSPACF